MKTNCLKAYNFFVFFRKSVDSIFSIFYIDKQLKFNDKFNSINIQKLSE